MKILQLNCIGMYDESGKIRFSGYCTLIKQKFEIYLKSRG